MSICCCRWASSVAAIGPSVGGEEESRRPSVVSASQQRPAGSRSRPSRSAPHRYSRPAACTEPKITQQSGTVSWADGQTQSEPVRTDTVRHNQNRSGQIRSDTIRTGQDRYGQTQSEPVRTDTVIHNQNRSGQIRSDTIRTGQDRYNQTKSERARRYQEQGCRVDGFPGDSDSNSDPPESTPTRESTPTLYGLKPLLQSLSLHLFFFSAFGFQCFY